MADVKKTGKVSAKVGEEVTFDVQTTPIRYGGA